MFGAIVVESVANTLGVARQDLRDFLDTAEEKLGSMRGQLSRRVDALVSAPGSDAERADEVIEYSRTATAGFDKDALKFVAAIAGTAWGAGIVSAGVSTAGTVMVAGLGVSVAPIVAVVLGLVVMVICGRYAWGVLKEMIGRLQDESEKLADY